MNFEEYKQKTLAEYPEVNREYDMLKHLDMVPVNDLFCEMMNWAVRYALGRKTYAVKDTVEYITSIVKVLDDNTLITIVRDIKEHAGMNNLGHDIDKVEWMNLDKIIKNELIKRGTMNVQCNSDSV